MLKKKRRLNNKEVDSLRAILVSVPKGSRIGVRALARHFGCSRIFVKRAVEELDRQPSVIETNLGSPVKIEPFTTEEDHG